MFLIYKSYPNSIAATIVSILSSLFGAMGIMGIVVLIAQSEPDSVPLGIILIVTGGIGFWLLRKAAEKIAKKKEAKLALKKAQEQASVDTDFQF